MKEGKMGEKKIKISKIDVWFSHFINNENSKTFLNRMESAKAAGYKGKDDHSFRSIGCENFTKLADKIKMWLDEEGLSENALKLKLINLLNAKETKFFQKDGIITQQVDVAAIETQRRALDMAMKIRGMYAPEKHEHNIRSVKLVTNVED
jgi:hypothetical protein